MNTRQEIVDVFDRCPGDTAPPAVFTQTGTVGQMRACGAAWPEANFEPRAMAELSLQMSRMFGFATARVPYDLTAEAERLGALVRRGSGEIQPSICGSPYMTPDGFDLPPEGLMDVDEFLSGGRPAMIAEAAGDIAKGNPDLFVTAGMQDAASIAMQMVGAENAIMAYMMEPGKLEAWIDAMQPYAEAYARLLSEAADNVTVIAGANTDLFMPEHFRDTVGPRLRSLIGSVKDSFSTVHSCGDSFSLLDDIVRVGADGLSLEASHDPEGFLEKAAGRCLMFGSIDPVGTLMSKGPAEVASEARMYADLGFDIVTPECGVPPITPNCNLMALAHYRD